MDFGKLLNVAQRNSDNGKKAEVKYYPAKFAPPKKESKEKKLSENIKRFLEKKEQEEKEKAIQERQKRLELEAKRDPKMKRKIEKMLKVIKSANKSVLEDAVDHNDTALTLEGPEQPDEDDYGYTSNVSDALHKQLMDKYKNMPEDKMFKDSVKQSMSKEQIARAKERVRDTLNKIHEEEALPHKRQRKSKVHQDGDVYEPEVKAKIERVVEPEKKKEVFKKPKRPPGPPPLDFASLLKIAEQKQHQPIEAPASKKKEDLERPMTKKEREELQERNKYLEEKKKRDMIRNNPELLAKAKAMAASKNDSAQKMVPGGRIPKMNGSSTVTSDKPIQKSTTVTKENGKISKPLDAKPSSSKKNEDKTSKSKLETALTAPTKPSVPPTSSKVPPSISKPPPTSSKPSTSKASSSSSSSSAQKPTQKPTKDLKDVKPRPSSSGQEKTRQFPPPDVQKTRQFPPPDVQKARQFPPPDVISKKKQKEKLQEMLNKKRRIVDDDDDSEYDSEMDDFIDDEEPEVDFSAEIRNIFGYDKRRFRDEDDDDREMESTFAQQMREEYISKKIGIMEDLEDMRMEEEEKKRKTTPNKKPKKR